MEQCQQLFTGILSTSIALALLHSPALAGDLAPPVGPIGPEMKTLDAVEPRIAINTENTPGTADALYRINQKGSYYLTSDLRGVPDKHGILIEASNVTIDLMGFVVQGVTDSLDGISAANNGHANIYVSNGSIQGWGGQGVFLLGYPHAQLQSLRISDNGSQGIYASSSTTVENCSAWANGQEGILVSGSRAIVRSCLTYDNGDAGIQTSWSAAITDCVSHGNAGSGIIAGTGTVISRCVSQFNGNVGVATGNNANVTDCSAASNGSHGFSISSSGIISGCTSSSNSGHGINAGGDCLIVHNNCTDNESADADAAGIYVSGNGNRIEANDVSSNDFGIQVDRFENLIISNNAQANTVNYEFLAGNRFGPIIDLTSGATPAVSGNAATTTLLSADPRANYAQ